MAARDLPVGERNSPRELDLPEASRNKSPNSLKVRSKIRQASEYYMEVLGVSGMTVGRRTYDLEIFLGHIYYIFCGSFRVRCLRLYN